MNKNKKAVFDIVVQKKREKIWNSHSFVVSLQTNNKMMKKESKPYPIIDEEDGSSLSAQEPICNAACDYDEFVIPDEVAYARIVDGVLQINYRKFSLSMMSVTAATLIVAVYYVVCLRI